MLNFTITYKILTCCILLLIKLGYKMRWLTEGISQVQDESDENEAENRGGGVAAPLRISFRAHRLIDLHTINSR